MSVTSRFSKVLVVLALLFGLTIVAGPPASAIPQDSGIRLMPVPAQRSSIDTVVVANGTIFYSDPAAHVVRFLAPEGPDFIGTEGLLVGNGSSGIPVQGDAVESPMISPTGLAYDEQSDTLYIADTGANMVVAVWGLANDPTTAQLGIVAGTGVAGSPVFNDRGYRMTPYGPDSELNGPRALAVNPGSGMLAIADTGNNAVHFLDSSFYLYPAVGPDVSPTDPCFDGVDPVYPSAESPRGLFWGDRNNLYIADTGNHRVMLYQLGDDSCSYTTFAGTGVAGAVTEGPATESKLSAPVSIDSLSPGIVIADEGNHQILGVFNGDLGVVAGNGSADPIDYNSTADPSSSGIGSISQAKFFGFSAMLVDSTNNIFAYVGQATAPSEPTPLGATPGNGSASISFTAPSDNGGRAITNYQFTTNGGSTWTDADAGTTSPVTISGLTNGTTYSVKLRAVNSIGEGEMSSVAVSVTPSTVPAAPTSLVATPGDGSASIAFTTGSDGGASITNYEYQLDGGSWVALSPADTTSPVTIPSLTNGTTYAVKLRAVNSVGGGTASASVSLTPVAPAAAGPALCAALALGKHSIQACWNPFVPAQGKTNRYRAYVFVAGTNTKAASCKASATETSCVVKGGGGKITALTDYDVRVRARVGISPGHVVWSSYSNALQVTTLE